MKTQKYALLQVCCLTVATCGVRHTRVEIGLMRVCQSRSVVQHISASLEPLPGVRKRRCSDAQVNPRFVLSNLLCR